MRDRYQSVIQQEQATAMEQRGIDNRDEHVVTRLDDRPDHPASHVAFPRLKNYTMAELRSPTGGELHVALLLLLIMASLDRPNRRKSSPRGHDGSPSWVACAATCPVSAIVFVSCCGSLRQPPLGSGSRGGLPSVAFRLGISGSGGTSLPFWWPQCDAIPTLQGMRRRTIGSSISYLGFFA